MTAGGSGAITEAIRRWAPKGARDSTVFVVFSRAGAEALGMLGATGAGGKALVTILGRIDTEGWLALATLGMVGAGGRATSVTLRGIGAGGKATLLTLSAAGPGGRVALVTLGTTVARGRATLLTPSKAGAGGGVTLVTLGTTGAEGGATLVTLRTTGATHAGMPTSETFVVRGRRPRVARWRSIVAMVAAVMVVIRGLNDGRDSALAAESRGFASVSCGSFDGRCGGVGRGGVTIDSVMVDSIMYFPGVLLECFCGGGAESMSKIERRVSRSGDPCRLEGSSRRGGRERSTEWSLSEESA